MVKINNSQSAGYNAIPNEQPVEIKEGEVYTARIKERISDNEAIIQVKGKEVRATFEGKIPNSDQTSIQVTESGDKAVRVKAVPDQSKQQLAPAVTASPRQTGNSESVQALTQAMKILQDKGIKLDKESFQQLKKFIDSAQGNLQQKLETVLALANKKVEVTKAQLQSVHEALHGKPLTELLGSLIRDSAAGQAGTDQQKILQLLQTLAGGKDNLAGGLQEAAKKLLSQLQQRPEGIDQKELAKLLKNMLKTAHSSSSITPMLSSMKQILQQEQSLDKAIQQIKESLAALPAPDRGTFANLEKSLVEAKRFAKIGWDGLGRERIQTAINQLESESTPSTQEASLGDIEQLLQQVAEGYDDMQMSSALASKDLIVTEITKRLSEAAIQFKNTKREIVRNMDHIIQIAQNTRTNVMPVVKPMIENTIDLLDKAILKSDITMLTDMETEKELMQASSQLAEARKHLAKGQNSDAIAVLQEVKAKLETLNWRPSNVRVQHFLTGNSMFMEDTPSIHHLAGKMADLATHFQQHEPSARNMYEFMRSLGLNHESEVAQALSAGKDGSVPADLEQNMKAALLHLAKTEAEQGPGHTAHTQVEQALNNLTGQQLLSKSESGSNLQSMFFNLPLMLGGKLQNVKLFLNSKNEGQKVDWENCSLYFMIETRKLGPTGILLSAVDRNLSITVKNDNPQLKTKLEPVVTKYKENLKELGYNIAGVKFSPLLAERVAEPSHMEKTASIPQQANTPAKGFDFKI